MVKRIAYATVGGWGLVLLVLLPLWPITGKFKMMSLLLLGNAFGACVVQWAERRGKVESIEQLHRPLTLFPRDDV